MCSTVLPGLHLLFVLPGLWQCLCCLPGLQQYCLCCEDYDSVVCVARVMTVLFVLLRFQQSCILPGL